MPNIVINAVLFQALWFTAILTGWQWSLMPLILLVAHFLYVEKRAQIRWACFALIVVGLLADSLLTYLAIYQFPENTLYIPGMLPLWLSYMWIGFSLCLPLSLNWLFRSPILLIAFFTVGGAMSYVGGRALGALSFSDSAIGILAAVWFGLSLLVWFAYSRSAGVKEKKNGSVVCG